MADKTKHYSPGLATVIEYPGATSQKRTTPQEPTAAPAHKLDLLQHIPDCMFKRYAIDVAKMCWLPQNSVFFAGIGVASVAMSKAYAVQYPDGTLLPLGEYVLPANPSATAKSRCLKSFQWPMFDATKAAIKIWRQNKDADPDYNEPYPFSFFVTNSSSAALDKALGKTNGYFALVSAEQGLINTITGAAFSGKGSANNNDDDLMLLGFNADYNNSDRVGRDTYTGEVVGAVTCFAQPKVIKTILEHSEGSGFAERFLMFNEDTFLGRRDHHQKHCPNEYDQTTYNRIIGDIARKVLAEGHQDFSELPAYRLSTKAWWDIDEFRNEIEPFMNNGGKYSTETLRSIAGKPDMHIMKIATILAILDDCPIGDVPDKWVTAAINVMRDYLDYLYWTLVDMGEIGTNALEDSVIAYLSDKRTATRRQFDQARRKSKPWAELPKASVTQAMRDTIDGLIDKGIVGEFEEFDAIGKSSKTLKLIA